MTRNLLVRAMFAGTAMMMSTTALAQDAEPQPDPSDATADAAIAEAAAIDDAQAKIDLLEAQVEALQESLVQIQASMVKATPSWKGAPLFEDKDAGWSFKPRGRLQYDVGYVNNPDDSIITRNLGFNTRARRIRLGAEGTIPGGLGYKFEADFANGSVGFGDVILTYSPKNAPLVLTIGNHETLNGLEQMSSSRFSSFVERAAFDDAFINTRRIGLSAGYANTAGTLRVNAGVFAAHSIDGRFDNDGWIGAGRITYSPLMGTDQLHFGLNFQHREFQSNNNGGSATPDAQGTPSTNQLARYRARPFSQLTDQRFVDTQAFAAKSDNIIGVEAAGIFQSLHIAAEGQYLKANAYKRGDKIENNDPEDALDQFSGSQWTPDGDPSFWGGYFEAGYFLTGETRGYKAGLWDRTKVLNPFSKGGTGAFQVIGRIDYLDLASKKLKNGCNNNFNPAAAVICTGSPNLAKGGTQLGFLAGLTWIPEDYMRVLINYSHASIEGGPSAALVKPDSSNDVDERKYGVDTVQARFQIDF